MIVIIILLLISTLSDCVNIFGSTAAISVWRRDVVKKGISRGPVMS